MAGGSTMAFQTSSLILATLGAATLFLLPACEPGGGSDDTGGTTGGTTGPTTTDSASASSPTSTTSPETTSSTSTDDSTGSTTTTGAESSSSTGEPADCVDVDIGDAVGPNVASGTNDGQGDDFVLRFCDGGFGGSSSSSTGGFGDTGGGLGTTSSSTGGTSGGFDESGDDYVVSWTPPSSGPFVLDTFGSRIDTVLSVVTPQCGAASRDCNDDCTSLEAALVYEASEGEAVFIVIEGYSGDQGPFVLNITEGDSLECGIGGSSTGGGSSTTSDTSP